MNADNNNDDRIEALLRDAAGTFTPPPKVKAAAREHVLAAAQSEEGKPGAAQQRDSMGVAASWRFLRSPWRVAGAASAALAALVFLTVILWPSPLTLAQVREAVESVDWIHVRFDNGTERWISLTHGIRAEITPDSVFDYYDDDVRFTDYIAGVDYHYHGRGEVIYVRDASKLALPTTAWEAIVGHVERMADDSEEGGRWRVERYTEIIDGRTLVRFDEHHVDVLDQSLLVRQIWADPGTRLPVKIRRRVPIHERRTGAAFKTGICDFPESGPQSIYDLGVRRDVRGLDTRQTETDVPEQVMSLVEEIAAAEERFISHYRVVEWKNDRPDSIEVLHVSGEAVPKESPDDPRRDYSPIRARLDHYFNLSSHHPDYHLPVPATADEVLAWAATQTPVTIYLVDGQRYYIQNGPFPPVFTEAREPYLHVMRSIDPRHLPGDHWPNRTLWPLAMRKITGRVEVLPPSTDAPPGTIGIRSEGGDFRSDYYVDPERDHICIRRTYWEKRAEGWFKRREETLGDLVQLPTGHWVAATKHLYQGGDPDRNIRPSETSWKIHITPLALDEFPPDIFDGEKLLENAREKGYRIETF